MRNLKQFDVPVLNYVGNENRREPFHISEEVCVPCVLCDIKSELPAVFF